MKTFQVISDLHLEHFRSDENAIETFLKSLLIDVDYVLIAGDIFSFHGLDFQAEILGDVFKDKCVIYTPGNHEYYGTYRETMNDKLRYIMGMNGIIFLENDHIEIDDIIVIGSTGWSDRFNNKGYKMMNDFRLISDLIRDKYHVLKWGMQARKYIEDTIKQHQNKKIVVLTHNAPIMDMLPSKYMGSPLNEFFANDWDDLIKNYDINTWISGHNHQHKSIERHGTRFIENSFGYYNHNQVYNFDKKLIIEV